LRTSSSENRCSKTASACVPAGAMQLVSPTVRGQCGSTFFWPPDGLQIGPQGGLERSALQVAPVGQRGEFSNPFAATAAPMLLFCVISLARTSCASRLLRAGRGQLRVRTWATDDRKRDESCSCRSGPFFAILRPLRPPGLSHPLYCSLTGLISSRSWLRSSQTSKDLNVRIVEF
jgi:hypothetical protein